MVDDLKSKEFLSALRKESEPEEGDDVTWTLQQNDKLPHQFFPNKNDPILPKNLNQVSQIKVNNVNNMNINIINSFPQQGDDLIQGMKKLNIRDSSSKSNAKRSKDLALNYYFGERPNKEDDLLTHEQIGFKNQVLFDQPNQSYGIDDSSNPMEPNSNYVMNSNQTEKYNINSQPYIPKSKQFAQMEPNNKNEVDDRLFKLNFAKSSNIPGKFFVIKSVDEANIIRSINYNIWCSTIKGNQKLQKAFKESEKKYPIYLFFSVNGSGKFMGLAQMVTEVEYRVNFNYWSQNDKWKGFFFINWLYIKDIPNRVFRSIINEYNDNKPVTSSRDTQEIFPTAGMEMLKIFKEYPQEASIFDQMSNEEKMMILQSQQQQQAQNQVQGGQGSNILLRQQIQQQKMRSMNNNMDQSRFNAFPPNMNYQMNMGPNMNMNQMYQKDELMMNKIPLMMQQLQKQQQQLQKMNYSIGGPNFMMNQRGSNQNMMGMGNIMPNMMQNQSRYMNYPQGNQMMMKQYRNEEEEEPKENKEMFNNENEQHVNENFFNSKSSSDSL